MGRAEQLAQQYRDRIGRGERISVDEWCERHPGEAAELRRLLAQPPVAGEDPTFAIESEPIGGEGPAEEEVDATFAEADGTGSEADRPGTSGSAERETIEAEGGPLFDGRYRQLKVLGEGGFGKVYLVEDTFHNDEQLALKLVKPDRQPDKKEGEEFVKRFRNEIRILRGLQHEGIPPIYNDGIAPEGGVYFTMAFVEGTPLEDLLRAEEPLSPFDLANYVRQIVATLNYAHARGVVHRDLKPGNVIVEKPGTPEAKVKVLDFGIAKVLNREGDFESAVTMQTQAPLGTPHYMSPEQIRGADVDGRTDLYALGIMIYRMVSGSYPFSGKTAMEVLTARLHEPPTPLDPTAEPGWAVALALELLEKEKQKRPTPERIEEIIQRGLEGKVVTRRTSPVVWVSLAALALVVAFLLWSQLGGEDSGSSTTVPPPELARPSSGAVPAGDTTKGSSDPELGAAGSPASGDEGPPPIAGADEPETDGSGTATDSQGERPVDSAPQPPPRVTARFTSTPPAGYVTERSVRITGEVTGEPRGGLRLGPLPVGVDGEGRFAVEVPLEPGTSSWPLTDGEGTRLLDPIRIQADWTPPGLELESEPPSLTSDESVRLRGSVTDAGPVQLELDGEGVPLTGAGRFDVPVSLELGRNELRLVARDRAGLEKKRTLIVERAPPLARVPEGCEDLDTTLAEDGWARVVRHHATGVTLRLVRTDGADALYLGETEVTRGQYARLATPPPLATQGQTVDASELPVGEVTFDDARRWCERARLRLPTAEEWIAAAQRDGQRDYPWGETWDPSRCHSGLDPGADASGPAPAGTPAEDRTPSGFLGLAGNLSEWCEDSGKPVILGGNYRAQSPSDHTVSAIPPQGRLPRSRPTIGFRVALDAGGL